MKISYEIQIWHEQRHVNDALGIPNDVVKFSNKSKALLAYEMLKKLPTLPSIEHIVLMEYGANKEFPDDGDVITEW